MSGLPPYGPGDLIDVDVDEDDRIWITMADHFARPLRLSRNEALALYLRGTELLATPGLPEAPSLAAPSTSSEDRWARRCWDRRTVPIGVAISRRAAARSSSVLRAARRRGRSGSRSSTSPHPPGSGARGASTQRKCSPRWVSGTSPRGTSMPTANGCLRADRIRRAEPTGDLVRASRAAGSGPTPVFTGSRRRAGTTAAASSRPMDRGVLRHDRPASIARTARLEVTLPVSDLGVIARLLLRVGEDASVLDPPALAGLVSELAEATLARYR